MSDKHLSIYLNDHLGGSAAGVELAKRTSSSNRGTEFGEPLARIAREIDEDRATLEEIMRDLQIQKNPLKEVAGWMAEKAGRLKLNGQILGYSPLSRVIELDALVSGVTGKLALWEVLNRLAETDPRLDGSRLAELVKRALAQRDQLDTLRLRAADIAFAGSAA
jgi:hypothetical protein